MFITTEIFANYLAFIIYLISTISLCLLILIGSYFLGSRSQTKTKHIPFESGINSVGNARLRISAKFYLVAIFFVIFEAETIFLYAWVISIKENGWTGFIEISFFILMLLIGLFYLIRIGALNWSPSYLYTTKLTQIVKNNNYYSNKN